jgi:hypothetical protein
MSSKESTKKLLEKKGIKAAMESNQRKQLFHRKKESSGETKEKIKEEK